MRIESMTSMHVTLLFQEVRYYCRGLSGQAGTLLQDVKCFAGPHAGGRWAASATITLINYDGRAVHAARGCPMTAHACLYAQINILEMPSNWALVKRFSGILCRQQSLRLVPFLSERALYLQQGPPASSAFPFTHAPSRPRILRSAPFATQGACAIGREESPCKVMLSVATS